jgi:hypothetical protein
MIASLRLSGLDIDEALWQSLVASPPNLDSAGLTGAGTSELDDILWTFSKLFRSVGLVLPRFSCPSTGPADVRGDTLPQSGAWFKARFMGLLGEVRIRDDGLAGAVFARVEERSASFALGG